MPPLITEVILPGEPPRVLNRIKAGLGIGGRMRQMGVAPLAAEFMQAQGTIDEVTGFAHGLWERHVRDDEMPPEVINVSRVNYFVGQILNGGFLQFVQNSRWNKEFVGGVRSGLAAIGAHEHLAVFEGGARLIDQAYQTGGGQLERDRFNKAFDQLEREHLTNARLSARLNRHVDDSWKWGDRWQCLQLLSARYVAGWRDVARVPAAAYSAALDRVAAAVPDLAARRQAREDARPWEKKAIDRLVAQAGLDHVWYTAFGARKHNGRTLWCWNFTVGARGITRRSSSTARPSCSRGTPTRSSRDWLLHRPLPEAASPATSRRASQAPKAPTSCFAFPTLERPDQWTSQRQR